MIRTETSGDVLVLTLEHGKVGALDVELLGAIRESFESLDDAPPGAVVLTGSGKAFSAGVDLPRLLREGKDYARALLAAIEGAVLAIYDAPFPVVAALNGHAIAGGLVLACAADHRLMAEGSGRVGVPELLVGVPWPTAALEVVRQAYAPNRVQELVYLGRTFAAADALERGLVDALAPADELLARATEVATTLAGIPLDAYRSAKALLHRETRERIRALRSEREATVEKAWCAPETHAAIQAYLDRTIGKKG